MWMNLSFPILIMNQTDKRKLECELAAPSVWSSPWDDPPSHEIPPIKFVKTQSPTQPKPPDPPTKPPDTERDVEKTQQLQCDGILRFVSGHDFALLLVFRHDTGRSCTEGGLLRQLRHSLFERRYPGQPLLQLFAVARCMSKRLISPSEGESVIQWIIGS
jgi:hypothetical protein